MFCLLGGFCFTLSAMGAGHFWWWWLDGILIATALSPIVVCGPRNAWGQFATMAAVLVVVGLVCTLSEAVLFFPETRKTSGQALIAGTVLYVVIATVLAVLAKILKLNSRSASIVEHRTGAPGISMVLLSGLSYVLYYMVFGAIAFQFFTKKYYPHAAEQVGALGYWFWVYQWGRGLLMTVAVLAVIYTLRVPRWKAALAVGMMIWIVGGGAPLLVPSALMEPAQRYMHIVEILSQNVSLGITAVWLLRPKAKKVAARNEQAIPA